MEEYLTIGEVARIKNISTKSLRYYEKIGILKPAVINAETGYRYYKNEQMLAVDMIKFLLILDIPLKNWHNYMDNEGQFDLKGLIDDGQQRACEKIAQLQICLNRLKLAARGLEGTEKFRDCDDFYIRMIPERNILCMPLENQSTSVEFHKKLSCLFDLAEKYGISANYPSGLLADICGDKMTGYVYVEIYERFPSSPYYRAIRGGDYICLKCPAKSIYDIRRLNPAYCQSHDQFTVMESDCISSPLYFQEYPVELQFPKD